MSQISETRAAPALRHRDAEETLRPERWPQVAREFIRAVDVGGSRRDLLGGEAAHLIPDLEERFAEVEVTVADIHGAHTLAFRFGWIV